MENYKKVLSFFIALFIAVLTFIWVQKPGGVNMLLYTFYLFTDMEESSIINYSFYIVVSGLFFWISFSLLMKTVFKVKED